LERIRKEIIMDFKTIIYEKTDGVARITFNRPEVLNAFNPEMSEELIEVAAAIKSDKEVRVVVLTGAGDQAFMSGADIDKTIFAWVEMAKRGGSVFEDKKKFFTSTMLEELPQPVIAAVNGYAFGKGCEMVMGCDIRIAADTAQFGLPEIKLGIMCGGGATVRLPHLIGKGKTMEMCMTGDPIDAQEAYRIGLVNQVVPAEELENAVNAMIKRLIYKGAISLAYTKKSINAVTDMEITEALEYEGRLFSELFKTEDAAEGARAFLEKRRPQFKGR
jgi:enoyl-CoA hydratase